MINPIQRLYLKAHRHAYQLSKTFGFKLMVVAVLQELLLLSLLLYLLLSLLLFLLQSFSLSLPLETKEALLLSSPSLFLRLSNPFSFCCKQVGHP